MSSLEEAATERCTWATDGLSVERVAEARLPTEWGEFMIAGYRSRISDEEFVVLYKGKLEPSVPTLVRIHSQCLTGDVFASTKCDCGRQLHRTMQMIEEEGRGAIVYQQQEGRGIGLMNKLRAYELQDRGLDTVEANESLGFAADARDYDFSAQILKQLGATRIRLLSNNPEKVRQLEGAGIEVIERVPCQPRISKVSRGYLKVKKSKMGHLLDV